MLSQRAPIRQQTPWMCRCGHGIRPIDPADRYVLRLMQPMFRRRRDRALDWIERDLVREIAAWLDFGTNPFRIHAHLSVRSGGAAASAVLANALAAAGHMIALTEHGRRQMEFLTTACPGVRAGIGWLKRLDRSSTGTDVGVVASAIRRLLFEVDWVAADDLDSVA